MSDKSNLEKFLQNFVAGEKEAASEYLSQVLNSKVKRMVNEEDNKEMDGSKPHLKMLDAIKNAHKNCEDKEAMLGHLAKACGKEAVGTKDFEDCAKHLHDKKDDWSKVLKKVKMKDTTKEAPKDKKEEKDE